MTYEQVHVDKGRTNIVQVKVDYDVSGDILTSEIRTEKDRTSTLIATWAVTFLTNGTDGELILTLDDSVVSAITQVSGYMDMKRVHGGEPLKVWDDPIEVIFRESVTA